MTGQPTTPVLVRASPFSRTGLTANDVDRIAAAIDAELAESTRTAYASAWRQWDAWCRGRDLVPLPAAP